LKPRHSSFHNPKLELIGLFAQQHTAAPCNTPQHTASHCNDWQHIQVAQLEAHAHAITCNIYTFHSPKLKLAGLFSPKRGKKDLQALASSFAKGVGKCRCM